MKKVKLLKSKKAISPIIADILLLSIIVTLMSVVWAFTLTYTANYQAGQGGSILERLTIEDVWFYDKNRDGKNDFLNVSLYNYGKLNIKIKIVFLNDTPSTFTLYDVPTGRTQLSEISAGSSGRLNISIPGTLQLRNGTRYNIKIFTERGYSLEGSFRSPAG